MSNKTLYYVCKYTPIELMEALGADMKRLEPHVDSFDCADACSHPNLCGYGKGVIETVKNEKVQALILTDCCDVMRRVYDVLKAENAVPFLYFLPLPHIPGKPSDRLYAGALKGLIRAWNAWQDAQEDRVPGGTEAMQEISASSRERTEKAKSSAPSSLSKQSEDPHAENTGIHERSLNETKISSLLQNWRKSRSQALKEIQLVKNSDYISLRGAHAGISLQETLAGRFPVPVLNESCTGPRLLGALPGDLAEGPLQDFSCDEQRLLTQYAHAVLTQAHPCMRMQERSPEKIGLNEAGVIYHTIKFCDYYGFEYRDLRMASKVPILKIETDNTPLSSGQISTRLDALSETLRGQHPEWTKQEEKQKSTGRAKKMVNGTFYTAGVDSGSTSTDAVIMDGERHILGKAILPTGRGAAAGAQKALEEALAQAGVSREDLSGIVMTGYGRETVGMKGKSITEITCHAKGAHFLRPSARTVIDIGGQDSKVIRIDERGNVENFVMNDKCAAGTGRFLDMMAAALGMSLEQMSHEGLKWKEDVRISSMCTVFAESEVVSLIAQNIAPADIIHGLNMSVAGKTASLAKRADGGPEYIMTGGVSQNEGVVKALEEKLGAKIFVSPDSQLCGAIGAALLAME